MIVIHCININRLLLLMITNIRTIKRTNLYDDVLPHNSCDATPIVAPIFLALHHIGAAVGVNRDYASNEPVVIACATVQVRR